MTASFTFDEAARCLAELGHPHRLQAFDVLVKAGTAGCPVNEVQSRLGIPKSTLSHHLAKLIGVGLITQQREGRILRCCIVEERAKAMQAFIAQCCEGLVHGS